MRSVYDTLMSFPYFDVLDDFRRWPTLFYLLDKRLKGTLQKLNLIE
jgi:hypothetical protein